MKKLLNLEEAVQLIACLYLFFQLPDRMSTGVSLLLFFLPDLFAVGFMVSRRAGVVLYNFSHYKPTAIVLIATGFFMASATILQTGVLFFAHCCFDRMLGYGLKYMDNPEKTHLGFVGKSRKLNRPDPF